MTAPFWNPHSIKNVTPDHPDHTTPGLQARESQYVEAEQDTEPTSEENRHGLQGSMAASAELGKAKRARNRAARYAEGKPLYDASGKYIGGENP